MSGLSLSTGGAATPTVITDGEAATAVTVSLTSGAWGDYSIVDGSSDGWYIYGPDTHPGTLSLSGSATALQNKTFTPLVSGHYTVILLAHNSSDEQVRLSALYCVKSGYSNIGKLAPQERDEFEYAAGWARSVQDTQSRVNELAGGRSLCRYLNTGAEVVAGKLIKLSGYNRVSFALGNADRTTLSAMQETVLNGVGVNATQDITTAILAVNIEDCEEAAYGWCIPVGFVPYDTSLWAAGDDVYISDAGILSVTAGTNERKCGVVASVGGDAIGDVNGGAVWFTGFPGASTSGAAEWPSLPVANNFHLTSSAPSVDNLTPAVAERAP